jgi:hypothetical protein
VVAENGGDGDSGDVPHPANRAAGDENDGRARLPEPAEGPAGRRRDPGMVRIVHDRRQRAIEIEEE